MGWVYGVGAVVLGLIFLYALCSGVNSIVKMDNENGGIE